MSQTAVRMQAELNTLIDRYESRRRGNAALELRDFLPAANHPLYQVARRELIRIDLECSCQEAQRRQLDDYFRHFPDLRSDRAGLQEIAYEDYRLRVQAGESPSAAEYERRYGVIADDWPGSDVDFAKVSKTMVVQTPAVSNAAVKETTAQVHTPPFEWDVFEDRLQTALNKGGRPAPPRSQMAQALLQESKMQSRDEASFLLAQALTALPPVGTRFLKFQLIAELGRGGFGCVYLAHQGDLANRLVALKITVDLAGEEEKLAQLQHTNVVPIYSVHRAGALHAVCMPYFGPTTLADVIGRTSKAVSVPKSGASIVETLHARTAEFSAAVDRASHGTVNLAAGNTLPKGGTMPPTLKNLGSADYVNAILWLMERVTEGLEHAHERGILHGDLKPANVLMTIEGQPMLLDFNLATDIKVRAGLGELRVGGTLPYMAPEHLEALTADEPKQVDARSDLYGVGVIFYELLTGRLPFETPRGPLRELVPGMIAERRNGPPPLRPFNAAISPAVESLVRKCLEPNLEKRYQSAKELREDLQLHRQHYPLQHAPDPSVPERARKWMRRHPRLMSPTSMGVLVVLVLSLVTSVLARQRWEDYQTSIGYARQETEAQRKEREKAEARADDQEKAAANAKSEAKRAEFLNNARKFHVDAAIARSLMDRVNLTRLRPETWPIESARLQAEMVQAMHLLSRYDVLADTDWKSRAGVTELPPEDQRRLRHDVAAVLFCLGQAEQMRAERLLDNWVNDPSARTGSVCAALAGGKFGFCALTVPVPFVQAYATACRCNSAAERCYESSVPRALLIQKSRLLGMAGHERAAAEFLEQAGKQKRQEYSEDAYWTASALAARGNFLEASVLLEDAKQRTPDHFGVWHLLALCHQTAGEFDKAEACFNTCAALKPDSIWIRFHRGIVRFQLRKWPEARKDLGDFIDRHPDFSEAYVQRAAVFEGQTLFEGKPGYQVAIDDLDEAIRIAPLASRLYYRRAELKEKRNDVKGAEMDRRILTKKTPLEPDDWIYRGMVRAKADPYGALEDLERAIALDRKNALAWHQMAIILSERLNRPREANVAFSYALLFDPKNAEAHIKRGLIFAKIGVRKEAVDEAELAIDADPSPSRYYQAACIYAITSRAYSDDRKRAVNLLAYALRNGYGKDFFRNEPDLQPILSSLENRSLERLLDPDRPRSLPSHKGS